MDSNLNEEKLYASYICSLMIEKLQQMSYFGQHKSLFHNGTFQVWASGYIWWQILYCTIVSGIY